MKGGDIDVAFFDSERQTSYRSILTKPDLNSQDLLTLNDMLTEDFAKGTELESENETLKADNQSLRDTNHKLFLRVTNPAEDNQQNTEETLSKEDVFKKMIEEGKI